MTTTQLSSGGAQAAPAARPEAAGDRFASSFEPGEPQPDWSNEVETGPDGRRRAFGVNGADTSGIPGNVTDKVTAVRASGENTEAERGQGEPGRRRECDQMARLRADRMAGVRALPIGHDRPLRADLGQ
ncbi:hypothetical protein GCM10020000_18550 [Streptomyces olivoverticillatus]